MTPEPSAPSRRYSKLTILGFALALVGVCFAPVALVGLVLAFIGRLQTQRDESLKGGNLALATVPLFGVSLCLSGAMVIALPNFLADRSRLRQSECRTGLKTMHTALAAEFADAQRYSLDTAEQAAPRGGRYSWVLGVSGDGTPRVVAGRDGASQAQVAQALKLVPVGLRGECPSCTATLACVADLEDDEDADVWSVSTADRWTSYGEHVPPGTPHNDQRDFLDNPPNPVAFERPPTATYPLLDGGSAPPAGGEDDAPPP